MQQHCMSSVSCSSLHRLLPSSSSCCSLWTTRSKSSSSSKPKPKPKQQQSSSPVSPALVRQLLHPLTPTNPDALATHLCNNMLYHQRGEILVVNKPYGIPSIGYRSSEDQLFSASDYEERHPPAADPRQSQLPLLSIQSVLPYLARHFNEPELAFALGVKTYLTGPVFLTASDEARNKVKKSNEMGTSGVKEHGGNYRLLAICIGRPEKDEGELVGSIEYCSNVNGASENIFVEGKKATKRQLQGKFAMMAGAKYRVIASSYDCSLIDLQVSKFERHLPRLLLTHLCCPVLGDSMYQRRVARIFDRPVLVEPKSASVAKQYVPAPLLQRLDLPVDDYLRRLPMFMHVYRTTLPRYGGRHVHLVASAPPPSHFVALVESLGWSKAATEFLSKEFGDDDDGDDA